MDDETRLIFIDMRTMGLPFEYNSERRQVQCVAAIQTINELKSFRQFIYLKQTIPGSPLQIERKGGCELFRAHHKVCTGLRVEVGVKKLSETPFGGFGLLVHLAIKRGSTRCR